MRTINFEVQCPKCALSLFIPIRADEIKNVVDGSNFISECEECHTDFRVNIQLSTELPTKSLRLN